MKIGKATLLYFSPGGTGKRAASAFAAGLGVPVEMVDLTLPQKRKEYRRRFSDNELLVAVMPVYSGRLPFFLEGFFAGLRGDNTPAVAAVMYGNRAYDDAIAELTINLEQNGFLVKAAAAFIGQHNFSPSIATGRPDAPDMAKIAEFGRMTIQEIENGSSGRLNHKGAHPYTAKGYDPAVEGPSRPLIKTGTSCTQCGLCARTCPWGCISLEDCSRTDYSRCLRCFHCVNICPMHAKSAPDGQWTEFLASFETRLNAQRNEPEIFLPQNGG